MQAKDVELHTGGVDRPYKELGVVKAKASAGSLYSNAPDMESVNDELKQKAASLGANAVINIEYRRGMSLMSYKNLWAEGVAVLMETDEVECRFCAEKIKRAAIKCRFCGSDLAAAQGT